VGERREREPGRAVEVWAFDEHRLGLRPVLRRQWAPEGQRRDCQEFGVRAGG